MAKLCIVTFIVEDSSLEAYDFDDNPKQYTDNLREEFGSGLSSKEEDSLNISFHDL